MKLLPIAAALALAAPGLAFAQTTEIGQGRLDLVGTAPSACLLSDPSAASGSNATFQGVGPTRGRVTITQLADPATAVPLATSINLALPLICNEAHTEEVQTANGGLARVGGNGSQGSVNGFREFLPYQVNASWAGQNVNATSTRGNTVTITAADGAAGQLSLVISVPAGGDPLVAGAYGDDIVLLLHPAN